MENAALISLGCPLDRCQLVSFLDAYMAVLRLSPDMGVESVLNNAWGVFIEHSLTDRRFLFLKKPNHNRRLSFITEP